MSKLITQAALDSAHKYLETASEDWKHGVCAGVIFNSSGDIVVDRRSGEICHFFVDPDRLYMEGGNCDKWAIIATAMGAKHRRKVDEEGSLAFLQWLVQENPVGAAFVLNKDDLSSVFEGGLLIDAQAAGLDRTFHLCRGSRYVTEEPGKGRAWYKLVNEGVHPLVAMMAATGYGGYGGGDDWTGSFCSHASVFWNPASIEELAEALRYKAEPSTVPYSKYSRTSQKVFIKKASVGGTLFKGEYGTIKETKVPDGWGGYTVKKEKIDGVKGFAKHLIELTAAATEINRKLETPNDNEREGAKVGKRRAS